MDPLGPVSGASNVERGGGFYSVPWFARAAVRVPAAIRGRHYDISFRVTCVDLAPQPVDAKAVAELVRQLSSDQYKVREEATQKLDDLGEAAHPLLEEKLKDKSLDLESAERIRNVLRQGSVTVEKP